VPSAVNVYRELGDKLDIRPGISDYYERSVATKGRVLDIGGQNSSSRSAARLRALGATDVVATDIHARHRPDLVDDITATTIEPGSFDGVWCYAVLEHVTEYWTAIDNIHRVLRPGGEALIYVPFCFKFHARVDYHRFTISELARMVHRFDEVKVFAPNSRRASGYGAVVVDVLTYGRIQKRPLLFHRLAEAVNGMLGMAVRGWCAVRPADYTPEQAVFFATQLNYNHGFCAWVRK
jgi:SAM-dependent methyltransferase